MAKTEFKLLTEKELRAIKPEELETYDINWWFHDGNINTAPDYIGRVLFDYDQGLSILDKSDPSFCLSGYHGPAYAGISNYVNAEVYNADLSRIIYQIKSGQYQATSPSHVGNPACSFT